MGKGKELNLREKQKVGKGKQINLKRLYKSWGDRNLKPPNKRWGYLKLKQRVSVENALGLGFMVELNL